MNTKTNIIAHLPQDLRSSEVTALGAFRDATRRLEKNFSQAMIQSRVERLVMDGLNIMNPKGRERFGNRIRAALGETFLFNKARKVSRHRWYWVTSFFTVEENDLRLFDLIIDQERGFSDWWKIESVGKVSCHSVARLIGRGDGAVTQHSIAVTACVTLRFGRQVRKLYDFSRPVVPIPDMITGLIAVIDIASGTIITFLRASELGVRRSEWLSRYKVLDDIVAESGRDSEAYAKEYGRLLDEGGALWQATRSMAEVAA